ncbi:MAG: hypothetical protein AAB383_05355 [Patescibacteria group bacterium]
MAYSDGSEPRGPYAESVNLSVEPKVVTLRTAFVPSEEIDKDWKGWAVTNNVTKLITKNGIELWPNRDEAGLDNETPLDGTYTVESEK